MTTAANSKKNDLPTSVSVKLDRNDFPLWRSLVLPIIRGCKLDGYILGTKECPQEFIIVADSNKTKNPSFEEWVADDQMLLGWLLNSMTTDIATQLMHCENSKQLWDEAQSLAGAQSISQITYLKYEFHGTRKGNLKMEEYLTDQLQLAGNHVTISDLIIQILNGLDSDYNPIVVKLSYQSSLTWVDLQAQLLAFESRLDQLNKLTNMSLNACANVVNKTEYKGNKFNSNTQNLNWRGSNFRNHKGG